MITGVNRDANNIFSGVHSSLERVRTDYSGASESDLRDLNRKDVLTDVGIEKDEIEYVVDDKMYDQNNEWEKDEWERLGDMFK